MCCKKSLNIDPVAQLFRPGFVEEYRSIILETETKNKVYCSYKKCSAFIPPPSIKGKNATCQKCSRQTCTRCKALNARSVVPTGAIIVAVSIVTLCSAGSESTTKNHLFVKVRAASKDSKMIQKNVTDFYVVVGELCIQHQIRESGSLSSQERLGTVS